MTDFNTSNLTDEEILNYTKSVRVRAVETLTTEGIPTGNQQAMDVIFKSLDGLDRQALGNMRIKTETTNAGKQLELAKDVVNRILSGEINLPKLVVDSPEESRLIELPEELSNVEVVPGEIDLQATGDSMEEWRKRMDSAT